MQLAKTQRLALAANLRSHLKKNKLTLRGFAKAAGINSGTAAKLTQPGKFQSVQSGTRSRLSKAMGVSWNDLIAESNHRSNGHARPNGAPAMPVNGARRMLVIEVAGTRIHVPAGAEVSILDDSTIRVK